MSHLPRYNDAMTSYRILSKYLRQDTSKVADYQSANQIMINDRGAVLTSELAGLPVGTVLEGVNIVGDKVTVWPDYGNVDRVEFQIYPDNGAIAGPRYTYFQPPRYRIRSNRVD